jgi:hypothetical protein
LEYGPEIFKVTSRSVKPVFELLYKSMFCAPLFAALAAFIPIVLAIKQEAAEVLKEA